jgi:hypothetical protein
MEGVRGSIPLPPTIKIKRLAGSSVGTAHEMPMKQAVGNVFVEDDVRYGRQKTAAMGRKPLRSRSQPTAAVFPSIVLRPWCGMSSEPEHNLAKVGVEGSNPFARSKFPNIIRALPGHGRIVPSIAFFGEAWGKQSAGFWPSSRPRHFGRASNHLRSHMFCRRGQTFLLIDKD